MRLAVLAFCFALAPAAVAQQQLVDPAFHPAVVSPGYANDGPRVAIDEAHSNRHTMDGNYKPFAELLRIDGYKVEASKDKVTSATLRDLDVFAIVNATAPFDASEADALSSWVSDGGSLLLIADHAPYGAATQSLSARFGVKMGEGWAYDRDGKGGITTQLAYTRENGRLGRHPIISGRSGQETLGVVRTFTGQSLSLPPEATALLSFGLTAREAPDANVLNAAAAAEKEGTPAPLGTTSLIGRVQGLAMPFGRGRVVVLGEAGMFSAQVVKFPPGSGRQDIYFGMQMPGTDDKQFALNVMHWLSRLID